VGTSEDQSLEIKDINKTKWIYLGVSG